MKNKQIDYRLLLCLFERFGNGFCVDRRGIGVGDMHDANPLVFKELDIYVIFCRL